MARSTVSSIVALVREAAQHNPEAIALLAPERRPASYADLLASAEHTAQVLHSAGIGRGDRVAVVLDNGPEMAVLFLSVAGVAACAPLNPASRELEFEYYLSDLKPKAVIVAQDSRSPVLIPAKVQGIPVLRLHSSADQPCGTFRLHGEHSSGRAFPGAPPEPGDPALLLHTSGTTSRPKLVVLTNANLWHSAQNICRSLELTDGDRCLNIMPLFHIHGLAGAVLSSIFAGGSIVCSPGLLAPKFFDWMREFRPAWYTAVPTMHKAIVNRCAAHRDVIAACPLRFIRSCSSALPPQLMAELEQAFAAPVLEAYGMTEAAHQMCCNPLPPRARKPGSVGVATGPEVAVMNDTGAFLAPGERGHVVIRGANVTPGYADNAAANAAAFAGEWFRTGDQGFLDAEGYLFLSGRTVPRC